MLKVKQISKGFGQPVPAGTVAGVSVHAIITAGDGAKVAINIISELNGARYVDHDMLKA